MVRGPNRWWGVAERGDTGRLEAFSDGVFAIAITLLIPDVRVEQSADESLATALATEWAYRHPFTSNTQRAAALAPWLQHYNTQRRHSALGGHPPIHRLPPT